MFKNSSGKTADGSQRISDIMRNLGGNRPYGGKALIAHQFFLAFGQFAVGAAQFIKVRL